MPKIRHKKTKPIDPPGPETKEYIILEDYKLIDDGFDIAIYIKDKDHFGNDFYKFYGSFAHKLKPSKTKPNNIFMGGNHVHDVGVLLKHLLEENQNLKFYNKLEKALK